MQTCNTLSLEVGSNLSYAEHVNEGYTISKGYFVPGYWDGESKIQIVHDREKHKKSRFIYDHSANTGMWVRPRSFIGRKYFDIALEGFQRGMQGLIEKLLQEEFERVMR